MLGTSAQEQILATWVWMRGTMYAIVLEATFAESSSLVLRQKVSLNLILPIVQVNLQEVVK